MDVRCVVVNNLHENPIIFYRPFQNRYYFYSKVHVVEFLQHFELERSSNIAKFFAECRSQRNCSWNGLHVCLSHRRLDSRDVVYAQGDYSFHKIVQAPRVAEASHAQLSCDGILGDRGAVNRGAKEINRRDERCHESSQGCAKPLRTVYYQTVSVRLVGWWLLIGQKNPVYLFCPFGEQQILR